MCMFFKILLLLQAQKETLDQRIMELLEEMGRQSKMLDLVRSQSDTYKKLYQRAMGNDPEVMNTKKKIK